MWKVCETKKVCVVPGDLLPEEVDLKLNILNTKDSYFSPYFLLSLGGVWIPIGAIPYCPRGITYPTSNLFRPVATSGTLEMPDDMAAPVLHLHDPGICR